MSKWGTSIDWLIITAANRAQARGYRAELRAREATNTFARIGRWLVVPDPGDRRIGSGASTIFVLARLAARLLRAGRSAATFAQLLAGQRILILHCGGDSKRLPAYTAQGKIFTPLPIDTPHDSPPALFDLILEDLLAVELPDGGGLFIASGDVVLGVGRHKLRIDQPGFTGVAYPDTVGRGTRHGVYVADSAGSVADFLHKPTGAQARSAGAIRPDGRLLIDTGLLGADPEAAAHWLGVAGARINGDRVDLGSGLLRRLVSGTEPGIDLYGDILCSMPDAARGSSSSPHWRGTHPFRVAVIPTCDFLHIGTTQELLAVVAKDPVARGRYGLTHRVLAVGADRLDDVSIVVCNSILEGDRSAVTAPAFVEACHARAPVRLDGRNILVGLPAGAATPIHLSHGWSMVCLPIGRDEWSAVLFGTDDDLKTPCARKIDRGTIGGRPGATFLARTGLDPDVIWNGADAERRTLWNARLWLTGPIDEVLQQTLWICSDASGPPPGWLDMPRRSLEDLLLRVDHRRLIAHRAELQRLARCAHLESRALDNRWLSADRIVADLRSPGEACEASQRLIRLISSERRPLERARLLMLGHRMEARHQSTAPLWKNVAPEGLATAAFAAVAAAVEQEIPLPHEPRPAAILRDQTVWTSSPVRIDFAGGWSDTPPVCNELGGTVVNAAVTLNGRAPIQAVAKLTDEPIVRIHSIDLGRSVVLTESRQVLDYHDPKHWAALPKAAIVLAGMTPGHPDKPLRDWLGVVGGGIELTVFSGLPKGSGLGTSSILGATVLAALLAVVGHDTSLESLTTKTSLLEQMMGTGGGWQDQMGGLTAGVKILRTAPGPHQIPAVEPIPLDPATERALTTRMLLYYTGYQRLAADILHKVVAHFLARDPDTLAVLGPLKENAEKMRDALARGDIDEFAERLGLYWAHKTALDPGATNDRILALIEPIESDLAGYELTGAGGGGFLCMLARDEACARRIRRRLNENPPAPAARFYDAAIDHHGLHLTVM